VPWVEGLGAEQSLQPKFGLATTSAGRSRAALMLGVSPSCGGLLWPASRRHSESRSKAAPPLLRTGCGKDSSLRFGERRCWLHWRELVLIGNFEAGVRVLAASSALLSRSRGSWCRSASLARSSSACTVTPGAADALIGAAAGSAASASSSTTPATSRKASAAASAAAGAASATATGAAPAATVPTAGRGVAASSTIRAAAETGATSGAAASPAASAAVTTPEASAGATITAGLSATI
jgi:hypothetical protein